LVAILEKLNTKVQNLKEQMTSGDDSELYDNNWVYRNKPRKTVEAEKEEILNRSVSKNYKIIPEVTPLSEEDTLSEHPMVAPVAHDDITSHLYSGTESAMDETIVVPIVSVESWNQHSQLQRMTEEIAPEQKDYKDQDNRKSEEIKPEEVSKPEFRINTKNVHRKAIESFIEVEKPPLSVDSDHGEAWSSNENDSFLLTLTKFLLETRKTGSASPRIVDNLGSIEASTKDAPDVTFEGEKVRVLSGVSQILNSYLNNESSPSGSGQVSRRETGNTSSLKQNIYAISEDALAVEPNVVAEVKDKSRRSSIVAHIANQAEGNQGATKPKRKNVYSVYSDSEQSQAIIQLEEELRKALAVDKSQLSETCGVCKEVIDITDIHTERHQGILYHSRHYRCAFCSSQTFGGNPVIMYNRMWCAIHCPAIAPSFCGGCNVRLEEIDDFRSLLTRHRHF
jgi:hypothetical protein